jgi:hypothetical protein
MINNLKQWYWAIVLVFCALLFLGQCSSGRKIESLKKENVSLKGKIDSMSTPLSSDETKDLMQSVMFDFLIFEEDLDKGNTSLTDIKTKIEKD